ncbi:MAG: 2Fe-2S iron-sulfur cluster-binding protein, partial [Acidimicrobiales bacterium]
MTASSVAGTQGGHHRVRLRVNGRSEQLDGEPMTRLSQALRGELGLTGTKVGCDAGDCGACTVLLDGEAVCACLVPIGRLDGAEVTTVESLSQSPEGRALQQAFLRHGGAQCGFCTPGMLMAASALLAREPAPGAAQINDALGGVLCRCTGYRQIVDSIADGGRVELDDPIEPAVGKAVGARLARVDGPAKVRGTDQFGDDGAPPDALVITVVRSPHPSADFELGDLDDYVATTPGVVTVLTASDI